MGIKIKYVTTTGTEHVRIRKNGRKKKRYKQRQKMEERRRDITRGKKWKKEEEI